MVDNVYLPWSFTVLPFKYGVTYDHIRFYEWLESMRKDVKCTIDILKRIFSCLKQDLRSCSLAACDNVWLTHCALHNKLLQIDSYDK